LALRGVSGAEDGTDELPAAVQSALDDDLNTPLALTALHALLSELNKTSDPAIRTRLQRSLIAGGAVLGLLQRDPEAWLRGSSGQDNAITELIAARNAARKARNFAEADRIRNELAMKGIILEDKPDGTTLWRRAG